jgi:predicted transcriptional regulator
MVKDGKINEVFDIIIRLKQKRVLTLLKKFDVNTKTIIMTKMKKYKNKKKIKKEK